MLSSLIIHSTFQCKAAGQEVQENVLRTMLDLQNNNKLLQKSRNNYELSLKKLNVSLSFDKI